jgi:predicted RNA-binding protein (virulence factor B family)
MSILAGHSYKLAVEQIDDDFYILQNNIKLPRTRNTPPLQVNDEVEVFIYHDVNQQLTATLKKPYGKVGDLVTLKVVDITTAGAFLDWGIPKDLFVPRSFHEDDLRKGDRCLVKIVTDPQTGRVMAKEKLEDELSNEELTVKEKDVVDLIIYKNTPIGYQVIINGKHLGMLHNNEVFKDLYAGDVVTGFIKRIKPDHKIDVVLGKPGHTRVETETDVILNKLKQSEGFLPYHDKTDAEVIYNTLGMSKKTFKMTIGNLYRKRMISIEPDGIRLIPKK